MEKGRAEITKINVDSYERLCHNRQVQIWSMTDAIRRDLSADGTLASRSLDCRGNVTIAVESKNSNHVEAVVVNHDTDSIGAFRLDKTGQFEVELFDKETGESLGIERPVADDEGYAALTDMHQALMRYNDALDDES